MLNENQIATSNYPYSRYSLEYCLDSLERIGCKNIEFYACFPHFHIDDISYRDCLVLKKKIENHHLKVTCFTPEQCLYPVNIAAKDVNARLRSINVFKQSIRCANELGAGTIVTLAGYGTLDEDEQDAWKRSEESLHILDDFANAYNVQIVLETSPREYTTTHNSKDVVRMLNQIQAKSVSGMIDTATLGFSGESMSEAITDLEGNLSHVHVGDGIPNGHLILGEGNLNIQSMMSELNKIHYAGTLGLEILNDKYMRNPHEAMEKSYNELKKIITNIDK